MGAKKNARGVQLDGEIYENFRRAIQLDEWRFGIAGKIEDLMKIFSLKVLRKHKEKWLTPVSGELVLHSRAESVRQLPGLAARKVKKPQSETG